MRRRAFLAPLAALAFFAAIVSVARADVHAPVGFGRGQTFLRSARKVFNTEGGGDDDARGRRLVENDPRYGAAVRRVLLADARDGPSEGGGEGAGDESGVVTPPRHDTDTPQRRVNVGVARLARRAVDAEDELAAEANGTKPRLTSPRPGPRGGLGASAKRASTTRDAGDDRPKIPTTDGPKRENLDPRWRLLLDDDDDDDDVWSNPGDLGADATASSSSQLLVVTDGRAGVAAQLADALAENGGALGEIVPALSWTAIGGPRAANAASAVPGVMWVGPVHPEDAVARAWDPLFEAIARGDRARVDDAIRGFDGGFVGGRIAARVYPPSLGTPGGTPDSTPDGTPGDTRGIVDALAARIRDGLANASGDPLASASASSSGSFVSVSFAAAAAPRAVEWLASLRAVHRVAPVLRVRERSRVPGFLPRSPSRLGAGGRSLSNYEATEVVQGGELAGVNTKTPFYDAGIDGAGQVVGSGDSGLEVRHCAFSAPGKVVMHRSLTGDTRDQSGHGTHVVGSIAGDLTADGSGSKYDGVAKKASVAFTDMGYEVNATRLCYCLSSATCSPNAADEDWDGEYTGTLANGELDGTTFTLGDVTYPWSNLHACVDGAGDRACTRYDKSCADEGMTDWHHPHGVPWNLCVENGEETADIYECAHDRTLNEKNFLCEYDGQPWYHFEANETCSDYAAHGVTEWFPDGFVEESLKSMSDIATDMYDHAKAVGASIHSDSWGGNTPAFDVQTNQVDSYAWNNLKFLPMFAAGNEGEEEEADTPADTNGDIWKYTDGRGTLGNPTNAKNCISVGAALSDNSEPIDNSMLATKLGDLWDDKTDWTWQVDIGGSEGTHWSSSLIRGFRADVTISAPADGNHSLDARAAVVADPVDLCSTILNTANMKDKVVIFRWTSCQTIEKMQEMVTAGAAGIILYAWDWYAPERFNVISANSATGWTIPTIALPGKEGELLKQLVEQRGAGVTLGISGPILPPTNKFENMASFSSLGPTYNWLIKPDLVAPGDSIYSASILTEAEVAGGDTCKKVDMDGTSMATPVAAGAFALLRQYFTDGFYPSGEKKSSDAFVPSAALLKAVMVNGAQALTGFESDGWPIDPPPSTKQGWGRIELAASVPLPSSVKLDVSAEKTPTNLIVVDDVDDKMTASSERGLCVDVDGSIEDLRVTLVWTDPPGSMAAEGALVNDLDLQLFFEDASAGEMLWPLSGDDLDGGFPFNGDGDNNVERVIWSKPDVGRYWINVKPWRVQEEQPFALAVTGQVTEVAGKKTKASCFTPVPPPPPPKPQAPPGTAIIGRAVSTGYLSGCLVYLDANSNGKLDADEPQYTTDKFGGFSLESAAAVDVRVNASRSVAGFEACADSFTGIAPGVTSFASGGVNPGTGHVVTALTTVAKAIDREDSQSRVKEVFGIPAVVDIASTDPFAALAAGGDGGKELLVATTLVTNLVSTLTSLLEKACGDASTAESHVVRALAAEVVDASGQAAGARRMRTLLASSSPSFDLASEETVESLVNTSVENAVEAGAITEANKPSSAATAAVAKLSSAAATVLKTDIDAASTPEAMMASAASVSAVMQGSEVKTAVADVGEGGGGGSSSALATLTQLADASTMNAKVATAKQTVSVDLPKAPPPPPPTPSPPTPSPPTPSPPPKRLVEESGGSTSRPTAAAAMAVAVAWLML